jgi:thiamine biosynthesis lipoprotein
MIDVGALGKGRLVDLVGAVLAARTDGPFVVDASGDILVHGMRERVALEHPYDPRRAIGVGGLRGRCAHRRRTVARGRARRRGPAPRARRAHGEPVREIAATWALAADAMTADAAATALFFAGGDAFAHDHDAQWVRMTTSGRVEWSHGCTAELFT